MTLSYLSVCSGIEAATMAWHPLGWKPVAFSEIEPFPSAVLAHHYPAVPNWGDMTRFQEWPDAAVDVLCGGTPCQSFSVAGLRKGLADPRGNLMLTFGAIAARYRPRWLVWENVPGVLSSNGGRDFGAFLGMLGELGYGVAYRVLDAQHVRTRRFPFAVPQRRRRVFVVGYLGDWRRAAAVLFDRESLSGHPAPRRETGERPALTISSRPSGGGGLGTDFDLDGGLIANSGDVGYCLTASAQQSLDAETETLIAVAHTLRGEGFNASEDGTGRGTPLVPVVAGAICRDSFNGGMGGKPEGAAAGHFLPIAIQERAVSENLEAGPGGSGISTEGCAYTLEAHNKVQAVAFSVKDHGGDAMEDCSPTLRAGTHDGSHQNGGVMPAVAFAHQAGGKQTSLGFSGDGTCQTLGANQTPAIVQPWAVRRLTPRECERLQGFPDDFTRIPWRGKPADQCPDGPRYKALGNSWAVNVAEWLGERIQEVDSWP